MIQLSYEKFSGEPYELPVESNDDALFRALGGAAFAPGSKIILPSGKEISGDEMQARTDAYSNAYYRYLREYHRRQPQQKKKRWWQRRNR